MSAQAADGGSRASAGAAPSALDVMSLAHRFGPVTALSDVSFRAEAGRITCLLGPSGCGKTTALRLVAGLERLQHGRICIAGQPVAEPEREVPPEHRGVGLVFQDYALFPHLSVLGNVVFGLKRWSRSDRQARAMQTLERVRMQRYAKSFPHMLSGGEQQRVALARALAPGPGLLLLDEPFSSLDSRLRAQIRDEILHLLKDSGCTTVMVTHDSEEAMFMADHIVLMQSGTVVQSGTPHELYCAPAGQFVAHFFSEINQLDGIVASGTVDTAFGPVSAGGLADGGAARVVIRPEGVSLVPDGSGGGTRAEVLESRLLGRSSLLHLSCPWEGGQVHVHARVPGVVIPRPGTVLSVKLDPAQVFVFSHDG